MSVADPPAPKRRFSCLGCLLQFVIAIAVVTGIVVVIGTVFNEGDNADQPVSALLAGHASSYALGDLTYFEQQRLYLVHLPDDSFVALYDKSARQQELGGDCRIAYQETAGIGTLDPIPGTRGALVEECNNQRSVWRVDGKFSFGNSYGDMDRFDTSVNAAGEVIVDTASRSCTRSAGVIGVPPFRVQRCGSGD
jgi:hypothetical protein